MDLLLVDFLLSSWIFQLAACSRCAVCLVGGKHATCHVYHRKDGQSIGKK